MKSIMLDLRVAWRRLMQRPGATVVAVATLALGIGGCLAMFALTDALLLRPLRFPDSRALVTLWDRGENGGTDNVGWQTVDDWSKRSSSFSGVAAMSTWLPTLLGSGDAEQVEGLRVSDGFFRLLGVQPAAGRFFLPEEDVRGNHHVAVLSYGFWQRRFAGQPSAIGSTLHFDGADYRVVGVLPADFEPVFGTPRRPLAEIWAPLAYNASLPYACRDCRHLRAIARLREGVSLAAARDELDRLSVAIAEQNPGKYSTPGAMIVPLQEQLFGAQRPLLLGVLGSVLLVLLMATANLAGVRFAATLPRRDELEVRRALGAGRRDLVRMLVVESAVVAALGSVAGALLARVALRAAVAAAPPGLERLRQAAIDPRALALSIALLALTTLLVGALPAWASTRAGAGSGRRATGSRERRRALALLVACDVALGVVLLAGAGLYGRSMQRLLAQAPGFRTGSLLTMDLNVTGPRGESVEQTAALYDQLVERMNTMPSVLASAVATQLPLSGSIDRYGVHAEGLGNANPELDPAADRYGVTPGYFAALGVPLVAGRLLDARDRAGAPLAVVVSAALAHRIWGGESALGKRLRIGGNDGPWRMVVGVVGDVRHEGLESLSPGALYASLAQGMFPETSASFVARTQGEPLALSGPARDILRQLDKGVAVSRVATMDDWIGAVSHARRFAAELLASFAAVALLLAALGVHGIVSIAVAARRRELGVRRALGSTDGGVVWLLLRQVLTMAGVGAGVGLAAAIAGGRVVRAQLYGVGPNDPAVLAAVVGVLLAVALTAALGPALRALRAEPSDVMREE